MRIRDLNWMQLEAYLRGDDRIVLPVGSTEQHAYLSLETDNILAERASVQAAEPLGVPVLPVLPYGVNGFAAYPGSLNANAVAMKLGATVDHLARAHHAYPTFGEGVKAAAETAPIAVADEAAA